MHGSLDIRQVPHAHGLGLKAERLKGFVCRPGYAVHTSLELSQVPHSWQRTPRHAAHTTFEGQHDQAEARGSARLNGFTRGGGSRALR